MPIWIDGDACPKVIKDILFRAAVRTQTSLTIVSNHCVPIPPSPFIKRCQVESGFDVADNYIVMHMQAQDLVITSDIPLADLVIGQGGLALNPRGILYSANNIKGCLAMRNFNESLRSASVMVGGPAKLNQKEINSFSNHLDTFLAKRRG